MSLLKSHLPQTVTWNSDAEGEAPERFSSMAQELDKLTNHVALLDFSHMGLVEIAGPERVTFLQGLTTNEIKDINKDRGIYSAMLTAQGRFSWDFSIIEGPETLLLETEPQLAAKLVESLKFYLMRTKATLTDASSAYGTLAIVGPNATQTIAELHPELAIAEATLGTTFQLDDEKQLWKDPRHEDFGWRLRVKAESYPGMWDKLAKKIQPAGELAWESYRILKGLPRGGKELIPGTTLPLEAGLLDLNGVSFQKGCFVGQETTARTHHRGTLKKRLFRVILEDNGSMAVGTTILTPSKKEAGTLTSAICHDGSCQGLAILRLSDVVEGKQLTVAGQKVTAHKPDWASWSLT